jgi:hypothetical protein
MYKCPRKGLIFCVKTEKVENSIVTFQISLIKLLNDDEVIFDHSCDGIVTIVVVMLNENIQNNPFFSGKEKIK